MPLTQTDRRIAAIAIPALGALAAEPLYVLADTVIVGHLGVKPPAGLALAGALLTRIATLCSFLVFFPLACACAANVGVRARPCPDRSRPITQASGRIADTR